MKLRSIGITVVALMVAFSASTVMAESDARKSFEVLKGMDGNWTGKNSQGQILRSRSA